MTSSRISVVGSQYLEGRYRAGEGFKPTIENQLELKEGEFVQLEEQTDAKGWVYASLEKPGGRQKTEGYVPGKFLAKVSEGDFDQWALGCEYIGVVYGFFSGLCIFLYGSSEQDGQVNMAMGSLAMIFSILLILLVQFRDRINREFRALAFFLTAIPLFAGWPWGLWGGTVLLFTTCIELVVWNSKDEVYIPQPYDFSKICEFWKGSCISIICFAGYVTANVFIFGLGVEYGGRRVEGWKDSRNRYNIGTSEWEFAQATGTCICFNITLMMIFSLQGFQNALVACAERLSSAKEGRMAKIRDFVKESFAPAAMMSVHKMFAGVILLFTGLHIIGCFAAYENSGPAKDFQSIFGSAPYITGGLMFVILGIVLGSSTIDPQKRPSLFANIHRLALVLFGLLVLHGKNWFGPNFWKWIIGPILCLAMDKTFRWGLFVFNDNSRSQDYAPVPKTATMKKKKINS